MLSEEKLSLGVEEFSPSSSVCYHKLRLKELSSFVCYRKLRIEEFSSSVCYELSEAKTRGVLVLCDVIYYTPLSQPNLDQLVRIRLCQGRQLTALCRQYMPSPFSSREEKTNDDLLPSTEEDRL